MCLLAGKTEERVMQRIYVSLKSSDSNKRDKEATGRQSRRSKALSIGKRKATEERTIKNCRARGSPFRLPLLIRDLFSTHPPPFWSLWSLFLVSLVSLVSLSFWSLWSLWSLCSLRFLFQASKTLGLNYSDQSKFNICKHCHS